MTSQLAVAMQSLTALQSSAVVLAGQTSAALAVQAAYQSGIIAALQVLPANMGPPLQTQVTCPGSDPRCKPSVVAGIDGGININA
jgi:hypothetical protein